MTRAEKNKFVKYEEYIDLGMYEEMFSQLKKDAEKIGEESEPLEKQKYINAAFMHMLTKSFYEKLNSKGNAGLFYPVLFEKLDESPEFSLVQKSLGRLLDSTVANDVFKELVLKGMIKKATQVLPFVSNNAEDHLSLFEELGRKNMENEFKFLLENLENIHFNNDMLLLLSLDMNPSFTNYMIGNLNFDVNKTPESENNDYALQSFVYSAILEESNGHLKNLLVNHLEKINMGVVNIPGYGRQNMVSFLKSINPTYSQLKIFLAPEFASKISTDDLYDFLYEAIKINRIEEFSNTDIFKDIFKHPNFKSKHNTLQHSYFLYECIYYLKNNIVGRALGEAKDVAKDLLQVLHDYLNNAKDLDTVPQADEYHHLGAMVYIHLMCSHVNGNKIKNPEAVDAVIMMAKRFPHLINTKNPRGDYVLDMTTDGSVLNGVLKSMGAEGTSKIRSLFSFAGMGPKQIESVPETIQYKVFQEKFVGKALSANATYSEMIVELKKEKENLWKEMQNSSTVTIHPIIFAKYEDIFKSAIDLLTFLNQNSKIAIDAYEETFFITNSMNKYIKESIDSYKTVVSAASRLSNKENEISAELKVRESCLNSLNKIQSQLNTSTDKFYQSVADAGMHKMKVTNHVVSSHVDRINGMESEEAAKLQRRVMANAQIAAGEQALMELGEDQLIEGLLPQNGPEPEKKVYKKRFGR